jgi:hypothetical protein
MSTVNPLSSQQVLLNRLESDFTYHAPKPLQPAIYEEIRNRAKELAKHLVLTCPNGRELACALTKLEECVFWANAGIARGS